MDDLASPRNDGFLTLSGVDSSSTTTSDHSKTPTPTPTPVHEPTVSKEPKKFERQSVSPPAQDDNTRPSTTRPAPRLDMGMARNRILSSLGPKRKDRSEGETARSRGDYSHRPESGLLVSHTCTCTLRSYSCKYCKSTHTHTHTHTHHFR